MLEVNKAKLFEAIDIVENKGIPKVELKDGTTTKGTIKATFSYIKVNNGLASNWVSDVDKVLSFSYKNHAKVS